jgi:phospholipase C
VYSGLLDHTSILQFMAERFAPDEDGYSPEVNSRRDGDPAVLSIAETLNRDAPRTVIPSLHSNPISVTTTLKSVQPSSATSTANQKAFAAGINGLVSHDRERAMDKFPEISLCLPKT